MNFFKCNVIEDNENQYAQFEHIRFRIPERINSRTVLVSIRPENISLEKPGNRESLSLKTTIYFVERLMPKLYFTDIGEKVNKITVKIPYDIALSEGENKKFS